MVFDRHRLAITTISSRGGPRWYPDDRRGPSPPTECGLLTASRLMVLDGTLEAQNTGSGIGTG